LEGILLSIEAKLNFSTLLEFLSEGLQLDSWTAFLEIQEKDFLDLPEQVIDIEVKKTVFFLVDFMQSTISNVLFFLFLPINL
jgi:hypothetical protein